MSRLFRHLRTLLLLAKYSRRRHCYRTLAFLLFDHIGGFDTVFYSLSNGSCLILCEDRSPDGVCELVQSHQVEVLPVAPSFLNLLFLNGAYRRHELSSLKIVTYGAEVMPQTTLDRCPVMFPGVTMMQKFGASEVGTLRSKSKTSDSLWVKLGGEGYETRVVDGLLEIKAESSMLGYLNAESPFTKDGWFKTGDCVDVDGEYLRFRGRDSDLINVGGAESSSRRGRSGDRRTREHRSRCRFRRSQRPHGTSDVCKSPDGGAGGEKSPVPASPARLQERARGLQGPGQSRDLGRPHH
jgi:acyl-CoA synthetase (AMP-forming)/AMP-acid ligase II